jgi:hypothetical protein
VHCVAHWHLWHLQWPGPAVGGVAAELVQLPVFWRRRANLKFRLDSELPVTNSSSKLRVWILQPWRVLFSYPDSIRNSLRARRFFKLRCIPSQVCFEPLTSTSHAQRTTRKGRLLASESVAVTQPEGDTNDSCQSPVPVALRLRCHCPSLRVPLAYDRPKRCGAELARVAETPTLVVGRPPRLDGLESDEKNPSLGGLSVGGRRASLAAAHTGRTRHRVGHGNS